MICRDKWPVQSAVDALVKIRFSALCVLTGATKTLSLIMGRCVPVSSTFVCQVYLISEVTIDIHCTPIVSDKCCSNFFVSWGILLVYQKSLFT